MRAQRGKARNGAVYSKVHKPLSNAASRRLSKFNGGLAQLGEHLLCKQGVVGSIPSSSTNKLAARAGGEVQREPIYKHHGMGVYILAFADSGNSSSLKIWKK